jgi:hypothetical protein
MSKRWPNKDPDEVLDYGIDWSLRLAGDTISTSTWIVPPGITMQTNSKTATTTTIWLSAGVLDQTYEILNRIVSAGGRTMDQTVQLRLKEK